MFLFNLHYIFSLAFILTVSAVKFTSLKAEDNVKIEYEYKTYEEIDLGQLEVKGEIITPGDLTVRNNERKTFVRPLFERTSFKEQIHKDLENLR